MASDSGPGEIFHVGVIPPDAPLPLSFVRYKESVCRQLENCGVRFSAIEQDGSASTDVDILWDPNSGGGRTLNQHLLPYMGKCPIVITAHGTVPFSAPAEVFAPDAVSAEELRRRQDDIRASWQLSLGHLSAVIAVSNYSASQLGKHLGVPAERTHVVPHGVSEVFRSGRDCPVAGLPERYFFHVSTGARVKNIARLVSAYRSLDADSRPALVLAMQAPREPSWPDDVIVLGQPLEWVQLAYLYRKALAFLFPSLEESFGLPIIEAMACGCPVITSNLSGCVEVSGAAALTVDPFSEAEILSAMTAITRDQSLHASLAAAGMARAAEFSWESSSRAHAWVFRHALDHWHQQ